jgi:hypothetical protein
MFPATAFSVKAGRPSTTHPPPPGYPPLKAAMACPFMKAPEYAKARAFLKVPVVKTGGVKVSSEGAHSLASTRGRNVTIFNATNVDTFVADTATPFGLVLLGDGVYIKHCNPFYTTSLFLQAGRMNCLTGSYRG